MTNFKAHFKILDKDIELNTDAQRFRDSIIKQFDFFHTKKNSKTPLKIDILTNKDSSNLIIKFLMQVMAIIRKDDYIIFHGAALAKNGKAKLFLGPSQSGKTTISLFSAQNGYKLLSDDMCVVNKKNLTIAPFIRNPVNIHSSTIHFFEEYNIPIYRQTASSNDEKIGFDLKDLDRIGISFGNKEYPIERIYIFRNNEGSILRLLPALCYLWNLRSPDEVMEDVKFSHYLLERYFYKSVPSLKLNTARQRRLSYNQIRDLLELT